jgi:hypothetical protein
MLELLKYTLSGFWIFCGSYLLITIILYFVVNGIDFRTPKLMQYHGKLYGKIGNKHFDTGKTAKDVDELVQMLEKILSSDDMLKREKYTCYTIQKKAFNGKYFNQSEKAFLDLGYKPEIESEDEYFL